jgi:hypothetical protein
VNETVSMHAFPQLSPHPARRSVANQYGRWLWHMNLFITYKIFTRSEARANVLVYYKLQ